MNWKQAKKQLQQSIFNFFLNKLTQVATHHKPNIKGFKSVKEIINYWSRINSALIGGSALAPGPVGLVATIPAIIIEIENQIKMIKDIATWYQKDLILDDNLILFILSNNAKNIASRFLIFTQTQIVVKTLTKQMFLMLLRRLSVIITNRIFTKWLFVFAPLIGPIVLGTWAYKNCQDIGKYADSILSKNIVFESDDV